MHIIWGLIVVVAGLVCWLGQAISAIAPAAAAKWGLTEPEHTVDPAIHADTRGEALWDASSTWVLPLAGLLLILDSAWWPHVALVGGGMYLYFAGRGITTRLVLQARGIRIGTDAAVRLLYIAMAVWATIAAVTVVAAVIALAD